MEFNLGDYCLVSSFDHVALEELELMSRAELTKVRTLYLTNFWPHNPIPPTEEAVKMGEGLNIEFQHLTKELVDQMHQNGKIVCVWIDRDVTSETAEVFCHVFNMGVVCFCTDYPLKA